MVVFLLNILTGITNTVSAQVKKDTSLLQNKIKVLKEVTIYGKTVIRKIKESSMPVEIIDLKQVQAESGNLTNILRRSPGVNIRTDGGVGDPINFSINGLDNKSIVLFKDGVPMSFYGHSFDPSLIASNMFDRIEVYKGVLPLSLGADALGGGLNFISKQPGSTSLGVSVEAASFNTQRIVLNAYLPNISYGLYAGVNASYTASDNNWKIDVGRDPKDGENATITKNYFGSQVYDRSVETKLKNNGVNAYAIETYVGIKDKVWVDDLRLTLINSCYYRRMNRIQGLTPMDRAAWSLFAFAEDKTISGILSYKKKLLSDKLHLEILGGHSQTRSVFIDTSSYSSNRFGVIDQKSLTKKGEITPNGADMRLTYKFNTIRFNAAYDISTQHKLQFNHIYTSSNRIGKDTLGGMIQSLYKDDYGKKIDMFGYPSRQKKYISALGLNSNFFANRLENLIAIKYYRREAVGYSTYGRAGDEKMAAEQSTNQGWLESLSYRSNKNWLLKTSYEYAIRLPDDFEVFGDSRDIKSNFGIKPEHSHNFNVQATYTSTGTETGAWMISTNLFYRKTKDMIMLHMDIPFSYFDNYFGIKVKGAELDFHYRPFKFFSFGGNATYMNRRYYRGNQSLKSWDKSPVLANLNARLYKDNLFQKGSRTELYWYWSYTHRYSVYWFVDTEIGMFEKMTKKNTQDMENWVPRSGNFGQDLHTLGIIYHFAHPKVSIAIESHNLTNNVLFDNHLNQAPGRSFSVKFSWQLGNKE